MTTTELIKELKNVTDQNLDQLKACFIDLSEEQKKWKTSENSWSILEIFAHLNHYAKYYHSTFKNKIVNTRFTKPSENFISSPLGRSAWKSMKLGNANNIKRKFKAPKSYNPIINPTLVKGNDIEMFENNLAELNELITLSQNVNLRKVKIAISVSKIIRLKLGDALLFVVYHNQRHIQQALNLLNNLNFPK
jgi:uncharacterized damage-inducible protein DinB